MRNKAESEIGVGGRTDRASLFIDFGIVEVR
jgi:hypothetical protein